MSASGRGGRMLSRTARYHLFLIFRRRQGASGLPQLFSAGIFGANVLTCCRTLDRMTNSLLCCDFRRSIRMDGGPHPSSNIGGLRTISVRPSVLGGMSCISKSSNSWCLRFPIRPYDRNITFSRGLRYPSLARLRTLSM